MLTCFIISALEDEVFTTGPPGKSVSLHLNQSNGFSSYCLLRLITQFIPQYLLTLETQIFGFEGCRRWNQNNPTRTLHHGAETFGFLLELSTGKWKVEVLVVQLCPTLCNPMDCSPPGSSIHGIFQERTMEWVAISFSRASSWSRIKLRSPALQADSLPSELPGKPWYMRRWALNWSTRIMTF